jgi:hypothetical protein
MSFSEASGVITQTGIDTDLSGLNGVTGVTRYIEEDMIIYDVASTHRIKIEGTVHHDPEKEVLIIRHDWVSGSGSIPALHIVYGTNAWIDVTGVTRDSSSNRLVLTTASAHGRVVGEAVEYQVTEAGAEALSNGVFPIVAATTDTLTLGMTEYFSYVPQTTGSVNRVTRRAVYNYGREITDFGNTRLSAGTGLLIVGNKENNFQERGSGIKVEPDGLFRGRGGVIYSSRPTAFNGYADMEGTELVSPTLLDCRSMSGGAYKDFKLVKNQFAGVQATRLLNLGFTLTQGSLMEVLSQPYYEVILRDFDTTNNIADSDIGHSSDARFCHRDFIVINSKSGSSVRGMFRSSTGLQGQAQKGVTVVKKEVSFNLEDASGNAIQDVEMHMVDTPDPNYSKNATFPVPTQTGHAYTNASAVATNSLGVLNADGTVTYDYTNAIEYTGTSDVNGSIDTIQVTTGVQILEYLSGDPSASSQGGNSGPYNIALNTSNQWVDGNVRPSPSDWDTTRFDGFYKVDRRGNGNTDADLFTFKFCSYGHMLSSTTQPLKGLGELEVDWVLFDDALITDTYASAKALTEITDANKFYDRAKAYLVDNFAGETETIVTRDGNTIDARGYDVVVDDQATNVFAFNGTTITIKATTFVGNIQTTGTITLLNNAQVIGTYGANTVLPWEVTNVEATATLQLYNMTKNLEVENLVVTGTAGNKVTSSGTYTGQEVSVGDNIRLRITCQAGTAAFLPYEAFGIATSVGISFEANQVDDTIYNDNGINADNLTTLSADYPNVQIDISDGDGIADAREFYAFYVKQTTTSTGIEQWFGAIDAIDHMNYRVNTSVADIKLQNTGSNPLVISGARIFRDNGTSILHADVGDQPMTQDNGELIQYIKGQVDESLETKLPPAIASDPTISGIDKNSKLIPALL